MHGGLSPKLTSWSMMDDIVRPLDPEDNAYCGEFDNNAAVMIVNKNLECSFQVLKAMDNPPKVRARAKQPNAPPDDKQKRRNKKSSKNNVSVQQ
ncbi:hypothetical protein OSTOST_06747 [Ostertagia ostertagi]